MSEIFRDIKEIEIESDKIIEHAEKEKEKIIKNARNDAANLLRKKEEESENLKEEKIKDCQKKAEADKKKHISEGREKVNALEKNSAKNIKKAVDFVFEKFEKEI